MALNRQRAEVLVGARIGYLSTTQTQTSTTQAIQFLDTGIQLVFRPFISKDGTIRLELAPRVSEASLRTVTDATGKKVTIPDELTNELTTNVRVRDGQTLVLGGLFRESTRINRSQVPFLGDIPILGAAFRGQDDSVDRDEIIFLITPTIVRDELLWNVGDEMLSYGDAVRLGARAGLLPFSRELVTDNYNRDAMEAYRSGDLKKALYYTNTSLGVDRDQPEIIKLREELTGKRQRAYDRSLLERALRRTLGPLPPEQVERPVEISGLGQAGPPRLLVRTPRERSGARARMSERQGRTSRPLDRPRRHDDRRGSVTEREPEPAEAVVEAPRTSPRHHPVTDRVPKVLSKQGFWRGARDPAGFDDPAWRQAFPFVTFDDMLEVGGGAAIE